MGIWHDARQAARNLARSPGTTFVTAVTLALVIGAAAAMFSIIQAVSPRPLAFARPNRPRGRNH